MSEYNNGCHPPVNLNEDQLDWGIGFIANHYGLPKEAIPREMFDFLKIVKMGANKYALNNWLQEDGIKSDERSMHDSMFHHLANSFVNPGSLDESGEDHLLNLQCRAAMKYTRRRRKITHTLDKT